MAKKGLFFASLLTMLFLLASPARAEITESEALFFTLNTIFAIINATMAIGCAALTFKIVKLLSNKTNVERLKAGYFLSMHMVSLSWKMILASLVIYAVQYTATTLFLIFRYTPATVYVLLSMYILEAIFMILLFLGIMVNYYIMRKYVD